MVILSSALSVAFASSNCGWLSKVASEIQCATSTVISENTPVPNRQTKFFSEVRTNLAGLRPDDDAEEIEACTAAQNGTFDDTCFNESSDVADTLYPCDDDLDYKILMISSISYECGLEETRQEIRFCDNVEW